MKLNHLGSVVAVAIVFLGNALLIPQNSEGSGWNDSQQRTIVSVNVGITDKVGKRINDLDSNDLKLFENGVEREIVSFECTTGFSHVVLLVDNSGSMRTIVREILDLSEALAETLVQERKMSVVRFVSNDKIHLIQDWTSQKFRVVNAINQMYIEGGRTALYDALVFSYEKINQLDEQHARPAIVLISDVEDVQSRNSYEDTMLKLRSAGIQVMTVSTADNGAQNRKEALLNGERLAFESGGITLLMSQKPSRSEIDNAVDVIGKELNSQCRLQYTTSIQRRDRKDRSLKIEVTDPQKRDGISVYIRDKVVVP